MHDLLMPQWAVDRVMERRGKLHVFEDINPKKTALIVIDLQNGFMMPEHTPKPVVTAVETVPYINRLAAALRKTGGKVFWIKNTVDDTNLAEWSNGFAMNRPETVKQRIETFRAGSPGHHLHPELEVFSQDEIVHKFRFSAFIQGSSDLPSRLRAQGFDTVLITGTVTNVCCESSARDAMMLNFRTIMVSDGNSARSDHEHTATLATFYAVFGDVMSTEMLVNLLHVNAEPHAAAAE